MVKHQDDFKFLGQLLIRNLRVTLALIALVDTILFFKAHELVYILLGQKWLPMVPYLKIFAIMGTFFPIGAQCQRIMMALKRLNIYTSIEISSKVLILIFIILFIRYYDLNVIMIGMTGLFLLTSMTYVFLTANMLNLNKIKIGVQLYGILFVHFVLGALMHFAIKFIDLSELLNLIIFCVTYTSLMLILLYRIP